MQFEAGKFYRTVGKFKAYCVGQDHVGRWVFSRPGYDCVWTTNEAGTGTINGGFHIIGEWQEQVIATWWAFTVLTKGGASFLSSFLSKGNAELSRASEIESGSRVSDIEEIVTVVP